VTALRGVQGALRQDNRWAAYYQEVFIRRFYVDASAPAAPFDSGEYLFEVTWDGVRALAGIEVGRWRLWGRTGTDYTARYSG
jgi:hypothetical protein